MPNDKISIILLIIFASSFYTWIMGFTTVYYSLWIGFLTAISLSILVDKTKQEIQKLEKEKEQSKNENI